MGGDRALTDRPSWVLSRQSVPVYLTEGKIYHAYVDGDRRWVDDDSGSTRVWPAAYFYDLRPEDINRIVDVEIDARPDATCADMAHQLRRIRRALLEM